MRDDVYSKRDYYSRWISGEFGNRPQAWGSVRELEQSSYVGPVNIRHSKPGSQLLRFGVPKSGVAAAIKELGAPAGEFRFNEPIDDSKILLQGEVMDDHRGWCLAYSRAKTSMRQAMAVCQQSFGLQARNLVKSACDASSFECICELLDEYPNHVVEFTALDGRVGGTYRNTIIWEVRKY